MGDEGVQEAGTVLHLLEPGTDDHGELIECAGSDVATAAFEVRPDGLDLARAFVARTLSLNQMSADADAAALMTHDHSDRPTAPSSP